MSDLVKVLIVGVIAVGAWVAIGAPTTIQDLRTDIDNIRNQFAPQNASAQQPSADQSGQPAGQDQGQQQPAADQGQQQTPTAGGGMMGDTGSGMGDGGSPMGGGDMGMGQGMSGGGDADTGAGGGGGMMGGGGDMMGDAGSGMGGGGASAEPPAPPDTGKSSGTAAPQPAARTPPVEISKLPPPMSNKKLPDGHPLAPPVATTDPIVGNHPQPHHQFHHATFLHVHGKKPPQPVKNSIVIHAPPHAVAKTHALPIHHQFHHRTFLHTHPHHAASTPGWYTIPGHRPCLQGSPHCICVDCAKHQNHAAAKSHLAYSYYANNTPGDLFSYY